MWRLAVLLIVVAMVSCVLAWMLTGKTHYRRWAIRLGTVGLAAVFLLFGLLIIGRLTG